MKATHSQVSIHGLCWNSWPRASSGISRLKSHPILNQERRMMSLSMCRLARRSATLSTSSVCRMSLLCLRATCSTMAVLCARVNSCGVSSVCGHNPGDLCVFVGVRGEVPGQGASKNPLTPIDPKPRPRLADSQPESLSSRSPASVGQATAPEGHPGAGLSVPDRQEGARCLYRSNFSSIPLSSGPNGRVASTKWHRTVD